MSKQNTKKNIVDAATYVIATVGLSKFSAKRVADQANVSKSSIFHHFSSTDELMQSVLHSILDVSALQIHTETLTLEEFLEFLGVATFRMPESDIYKYRALLSFYNEAMHNEAYQEAILHIKNETTQFFLRTINQIEGRSINKELAELITIDLDGLGMHYMIEQNSEKYLELWDIKTKQYIKLIRG